MKTRLLVSIGWVLSTFLLLSWLLYYANGYQASFQQAFTAPGEAKPGREKIDELTARMRQSHGDDATAILLELSREQDRYWGARQAAWMANELTKRLWIFWSVTAVVPLFFLWWPQLLILRQRLLRSSVPAQPATSPSKA